MPLTESALTELQKKKKTRFPLTRIKRIIQQNEDVGKAAAMVPVVLSKALELFMARLVEDLVKKAEERSSNKIQEEDLKNLIENSDKYSFMLECIERVPENE